MGAEGLVYITCGPSNEMSARHCLQTEPARSPADRPYLCVLLAVTTRWPSGGQSCPAGTPMPPAKGQNHALTRDRTRDLKIFSLTLSQLSYQGGTTTPPSVRRHTGSDPDGPN